MKKCPHCGHRLSFGEFILRYGSDTLVKHPVNAHPREHVCSHCHHKVWLHYDHARLNRLSGQYAGAIFLSCSFGTFIVIKPWMNFTTVQAVLFVGILLLLGIPAGIAYAKYQSTVVKEEK